MVRVDPFGLSSFCDGGAYQKVQNCVGDHPEHEEEDELLERDTANAGRIEEQRRHKRRLSAGRAGLGARFFSRSGVSHGGGGENKGSVDTHVGENNLEEQSEGKTATDDALAWVALGKVFDNDQT